MRLLCILAVLAMAVGVAPAQHTVTAVTVSFVDSVSGTNVTNITLGTTIQWIFVSGSFHTVTSGTGSGDPNMGALFNGNIAAAGPFTFNYTPTE